MGRMCSFNSSSGDGSTLVAFISQIWQTPSTRGQLKDPSRQWLTFDVICSVIEKVVWKEEVGVQIWWFVQIQKGLFCTTHGAERLDETLCLNLVRINWADINIYRHTHSQGFFLFQAKRIGCYYRRIFQAMFLLVRFSCALFQWCLHHSFAIGHVSHRMTHCS